MGVSVLKKGNESAIIGRVLKKGNENNISGCVLKAMHRN